MNRPSSINLTDKQKEKVIKIARELELYPTRGPGAGKLGSISVLLQAIADGRVVVTPVENAQESATIST